MLTEKNEKNKKLMLIGNYIALIIFTGSDGISWQQMRFGR